MSIFTNKSKNSTALTNKSKSTLLQEDGFNLLLETGGKILISTIKFTNKSKNSTSFTNKS